MGDDTRTSTQLLDGLWDIKAEGVWREFDGRYRPIVMSVLRRFGLSDADAADIAQETLIEFLNLYRAGRYDRGKGRLRSWLAGITKRLALNHRRRHAARAAERGHSMLDVTPGDEEVERLWDEEEQAELLRRAMSELKRSTRTSDRTLEAFEMVAVRGIPVEQVAAQLGMTAHDVYVAKSRVAERLRGIVTRLRALYEEQ